MPERRLPTHPATAAVRVRAFVEAYRREGLAAVPVATVSTGDAVATLHLADIAALLGDPEPADPPMSRHGEYDDLHDLACEPDPVTGCPHGTRTPSDPQPEFPDRDPTDVPW